MFANQKKSSMDFTSSRCQHDFFFVLFGLVLCCVVCGFFFFCLRAVKSVQTSAKQMCSSHCDRWPLLIMLIHNKRGTFFCANMHKSRRRRELARMRKMEMKEREEGGGVKKNRQRNVRVFLLYLERAGDGGVS